MNAIARRIAFIASLLAISLTTGCASLSTGGDGFGASGEPDDILALMAADSNSGGE